MEQEHKEVEIKLRVADVAALRRRLARLSARPELRGRIHENNTLFDTPDGGLARHGQLLRIRVEEPAARARKAGKAPPHSVLTYKGPAERIDPGTVGGKRYKVRHEIEARLPDAEPLRRILEELGLRGWFRYEKYRTTFRLPASQRWAAGLKIEVDETPIGAFLELEGPSGAIDRVASLLGYTPQDYITRNYLSLYLDQCRKQGVPAGDMLFHSEQSTPKKSKKITV